MTRTTYLAVWAGMALSALCGCVSRATQPAAPRPDGGGLISLGPKVGTPRPAAPLQIAGPANPGAAAPTGAAQTTKAGLGEVRPGTPYSTYAQVAKIDLPPDSAA